MCVRVNTKTTAAREEMRCDVRDTSLPDTGSDEADKRRANYLCLQRRKRLSSLTTKVAKRQSIKMHKGIKLPIKSDYISTTSI